MDYQPYTGFPPQGFETQYSNAPPLTYEQPHQSQLYPITAVEQPSQQPGIAQQSSRMIPQVNVFQPGTHQLPSSRATGIRHTDAYKAQLQEVARIAREVWNHTSGVKDMPGSVRVYVILYHILQRFREKYPEDPPLAMLIDGLSNNKDMRPVRNVNGTGMQSVYLGEGQRADLIHILSPLKVLKLVRENCSPFFLNFSITFRQHTLEIRKPLLGHGNGPPPEWDWTKDMVELPDNAKVTALARSPGIDDHKMELIKEALPKVFQSSVRTIDQMEIDSSFAPSRDEPEEHPYGQLAPSQDNHEKYYTRPSRGRSLEPDRDSYSTYQGGHMEVIQEAPILVTSSGRHKAENSPENYQDRKAVTYMERRGLSLRCSRRRS